MNHMNILCHIVGVNSISKNTLIESLNNKIYYIIDLDELNQDIFDNYQMKKMFKKYQELKNSKNDRYKNIEKEMTNFWEKNMINMISEMLENKSTDKKAIILGYNNHFRNLSKKINIPTNNRFLVETSKKDIRNTIKYNLETYKNDIIRGIYPLNNIDFDYLFKTKKNI